MKTCPKCGKEHNKPRAAYCSRTCANSRTHTEEAKQAQREKLLKYHNTPEGSATREKASRFITAQNKGEEFNEVGIDEWAVDIPTFRDIHDYDDFLDGYDMGEKW